MGLQHSRQDKLLTNVSLKRPVAGLIAEMILTFVNVVKDSALFGTYGNDHLRIEADVVGGETPYPRITPTTKGATGYLIIKHGLSAILTEEMKDNEEQPFDARSDLTEDLTDKLALGKEVALAAVLTSTSIITQNVTLSGTDQYNDFANSDPLGDWQIARQAIRDGSGQIVDGKDGFGVMPWDVFNVLKYHPDLIENIKYTTSTNKGLSQEQMRDVMGVGRLLIPEAQYNNSVEGQADNLVDVWGKNIVFGYAPKTGTKKIKTLGFRVQKRAPRRVFIAAVTNPPKAEEITVDDSYDQLIMDATAAYLIKDAIA